MGDKKNVWDNVSDESWRKFAERWLAELRELNSDGPGKYSNKVVFMNLTARPETQLSFILLAVSLARTDFELAAIAAGPIESFVGRYGTAYAEQLEECAKTDPCFRRALTGVKGLEGVPADLRSTIYRIAEGVMNPIEGDIERRAYDHRLQAEKKTKEDLIAEKRRRTKEKEQRLGSSRGED